MIAEGVGVSIFHMHKKKGKWQNAPFYRDSEGVGPGGGWYAFFKGSFLEMPLPRPQEIRNSPSLYSLVVLKDSLKPFRIKGQISEI